MLENYAKMVAALPQKGCEIQISQGFLNEILQIAVEAKKFDRIMTHTPYQLSSMMEQWNTVGDKIKAFDSKYRYMVKNKADLLQ